MEPTDDDRRKAEYLISDPALIAARRNACGSVSAALASATEYLRIPSALGDDRDIKGLAIALEISSELAGGVVKLYDAAHWYAGAALVRQVIESEYLLTLFAMSRSNASDWLAASPARLRTYWMPKQMHGRVGDRFDYREYQIHCARGGHPDPSAYSLLGGFFNRLDRRFYWIDLATHLKRTFEAMEACFTTFGLGNRLAETPYRNAADALSQWSASDPAPDFLKRFIEIS